MSAAILDDLQSRQLIAQLTERATELTGLCQRSLFEVVMRSERLGSTAIGSGIATPHAIHQNLTRTRASSPF